VNIPGNKLDSNQEIQQNPDEKYAQNRKNKNCQGEEEERRKKYKKKK
jgi:hypothetical protein